MSEGKRRFAAASKWTGSHDLGAPLLEAIAANPEDPDAWAVYADLLQTGGHPRGDLVSLMLEREAHPSPRLFEAQRRHLGLHATALLPAALAPDAVIAWRRGFASELRLDDPGQLAACLSEPSLGFVEAVTLVIADSAAWLAALAQARLPWRRMRLEVTDDALALAPLFAACPALASLRIAGPTELDWRGVAGATLRRLVLADAGDVAALDNAALPNLEEVHLIGDYVEDDALHIGARAPRVVLASANVPLVPDIPPREDDGRYEDEVEATAVAFLVVGRVIEPALVQKLLGRMSLAHLSARIGVVTWLPRPATVIQLFGTLDIDYLPYGLAIALQNVLPGAPPVALVEADEDRAARFLVLAEPPVRDKQAAGGDAVRRALDLVLGCDPGPAVLPELLEEIAALPIQRLLGDAAVYQLAAIDPSTAPVIVVEEPDDYADDDDDDRDEEEEWDADDGLEEQYLEPIALPEDEPEPDDIDLATLPQIESEEALALPADRTERWAEFHDHWEDRALAVDDESSEARWPDPERVHHEHPLDVERQVAPPTCALHRRALDHCSGCGSMFCGECGGEDVCVPCFAASVTVPPGAPPVAASSTS